MTDQIADLMDLMPGGAGFDLPYTEIAERQLEAIDQRFQSRVEAIKIVGHRAAEANVSSIGSLADIVPLLLPHTAYKSYPESFLANGRWDRLTRWLSTVSSYSVEPDLADVADMDDWISQLAKAGQFVSCTSGTTGRPALLPTSKVDLDFSGREAVEAMQWALQQPAANDRRLFGFSINVLTPRVAESGKHLFMKYVRMDQPPFVFPAPPITIGSITDMIALRKRIAEGKATPSQIESFEKTSAERQAAMEPAYDKSAEDVIAARKDKLLIAGMWATIFAVAQKVREKGFSAADFHPENMLQVGGGLKGADLPDNYREIIYDTFNIKPENDYQLYGMQEIGSTMPRCRAGRYHVPPWLVCLPLEKDGEKLVDGVGKGKVEGRAAFFDLSIDGRWGGVISGDHIEISYDRCTCGAASPSIGSDIVRYSDLEGDDKIACSGTVDAYVRGMA